jgi:16S rRNA (uracil1498-N3)-methyltransferase
MPRRPERRARVLVAPGELRRERTQLSDEAAFHLRTVLRAREGDLVEAFDGDGEGALAEIVRIAGETVEIRLLERTGAERESPLALTLAVAVSRGAKLDWVVEKATELGVAAIVPFAAERSVAAGERVERWKRIADAAAAQSGRVRSPRIEGVRAFPEMIAAAEGSEIRLFFWERSTTPLPRKPQARSVFVVTGPEGGFSADEARLATDAGFHTVGLGPRILRAETAAIVAVSLAQLVWGDLGGG